MFFSFSLVRFTFHFDSIKTIKKVDAEGNPLTFTFHFDSIKTSRI